MSIIRSCGFTDSEVQDILDQYGVQRQKTVHEDEAKQMFRDVLQNRPSTSSNSGDIIIIFNRFAHLRNIKPTAVLNPTLVSGVRDGNVFPVVYAQYARI